MALILTYHSHHVVGDDYGRNDHIAFAKDLDLLTAAGFRIVPLTTLLDVFVDARLPANAGRLPRHVVALTFDDGPNYDVFDFVHPDFGPQRSFLNIMRDFRARHGPSTQPQLHATSFVIASPEARRVIEKTYDAQYTFLEPGSMGDHWWRPAIETGLLSIANHSWDHLHPALPKVAHSRQARSDFRQVLSVVDADAQILAATEFISVRTDGLAEPVFAYPFGHSNDFLAEEYLPSGRGGVRAAFTVEPRALAGTDSMWRMPRFVCGHDWRTADGLGQMLSA